MKRTRVPADPGRPIRAVALVANARKPDAVREIPRLRAWLKRKGIRPLPWKNLAKADGVAVLGGDGTILSVAPEAAQRGLPVFGANLGHLGFLTVVDVKRLYESLELWLKGRWEASERTLLEVAAPRKPRPLLALNDAVIRLKTSNRVTTVAVAINGEPLTEFTGDGVIVSTTTGSTAYSLSAQGPVVHPDVEAFVLTPICPHSFSQRPMVFPAHHTLELQIKNRRDTNEAQLCLDGQRVFPLRWGDRVAVRRSGHRLKLVQDPAVSYFGLLRAKLHWGGR